MRLKFATALSLALLSISANAKAPKTAEEALAPYYAQLAKTADLPKAGVNPALPENTVISRFAFGSCNQQSRGQHMWAQIAAVNPQTFLMIGDNIYGDTGWEGDAELSTVQAAYRLQANHPEFAKFYSSIPFHTTWDDHDFGFNDGGAAFAFRGWAEKIYENFWNSPKDVRTRKGVYYSRTYGPAGKRVQYIMLDERFFRSSLKRMEYSEKSRPMGNYAQETDPKATMLGAEQWAWLEKELAKPADVRIIASSLQVITDAHNYEGWTNFPLERERLYSMLAKREKSAVIMLSGDRHSAGIYRKEHAGETLWEITSSSLNLAFNKTAEQTAKEVDPSRVTDFIAEENFGDIGIDWQGRKITLTLRGNKGEVRAQQEVAW